jgi:hypothetical protein
LGAEIKPVLKLSGIPYHQFIGNALLLTQIFVALLPEFSLKNKAVGKETGKTSYIERFNNEATTVEVSKKNSGLF